ncbi:bacteriohopanetetrol glucosamine biosynthesis glycosyltransferase HpnI [Kovacikia minuta CCNUW1]|uniref:bacteriohopanetetrol glucosamine biosynthesis glycosyltransferase HpnI n=1 Tax=Kovacikia minuta TaxID=2931930 RepID=UPI001CCBB393|nr:bacteriohopanetetrol glucosamine biosynthesis glycosyltransferase HpnI [Kovacikia minuta]UBF24196.1 bacteriohopanetetrol glucosamine biosynthesis glycosyltransferase HpnI [Kovacikia minuta CCNUW1]
MPCLHLSLVGLLINQSWLLNLEHTFQFLTFCLSLSAIGYYGYAMYAAVEFFSEPTQVDADFHPPISILKPICGLDSDAYENLASFCLQDYPNYQIIFGVQDFRDPSIAVVKQIIHDFPDVDIQLVISDRVIGTNLKVSNLANAAAEAKYDILLLADSDIQVKSDYLRQIVQPLRDPAVGVVTCMYRSQARGWVSAFEAIGISTEFLPSVLVARRLEGMAFAMGATIVIRKTVLETIGGFLAVASYLGDDFKLGNLPAQAGYQVVLSDYIVDHVLATESISSFIHHQTRWTRGNRSARPLGYAGLIFTHGTATSLLFLLATGGTLTGWIAIGMTWIVRLTMAWLIGVKYLEGSGCPSIISPGSPPRSGQFCALVL